MANHSMTFFTTVEFKRERIEKFSEMINSLSPYADESGVDVKHFVLLQNCSKENCQTFKKYQPGWIIFYSLDTKCSLSKARNLLLSMPAARERLKLENSIIAFPDDDCWYPSGALQAIEKLFRDDEELGFWFCHYGLNPCSDKIKKIESPTFQAILSSASSNTIFLRGKVAENVGLFDESLGIGTPMAGGEDTDYAIRAAKAARRTGYSNCQAVGHREFDKTLRAKYYPGALRAIAQNLNLNPVMILAFLRKVSVGLWLTIEHEMPLGSFFKSLALAISRKT